LRTSADTLLLAAARELLANMVKHADAHCVRIELSRRNGVAQLKIIDDGNGIRVDDIERKLAEGHIGLTSRRVRLEAAGGSLRIRAGTPSGTVAEVEVPATIREERSLRIQEAAMTEIMRVWAVDDPGPVATHPLVRIEREVPDPGPRQVRLRVSACGVCRTDLHLTEGDLEPKRHLVVPGHEVVGIIDRVGSQSVRFKEGDRVGVPWLAHTCGVCRFCESGRENLCLHPAFTGWDVDGGYAPYVTVNEDYAYAIPEVFSDEEAAPLLCAGIIGFRALRRSNLPPGGRLGIYGFGGSAHLTAQIALAEGARLHVMTRSAEARQLALDLGADSVGDASATPPEPLDAAILFAPVGSLVPPALEALDRGGTLAVAGIYLTDIPTLNYDRHLFEERSLCSVTANTREDGTTFLETAARIGIKVSTTPYPFVDANAALVDLAQDRVNGAAVLVLP
jgi:propanol-preferring alcohol dehydrogenase